MMQPNLIPALHASLWRGVLAVTGGGSGALERLLTTPGASATVLEAVVPYATASLADWLGRSPEQACSEATARALAMRAFERARRLDGTNDQRTLFGLGCTASLATSRPKRGEHRAHVAVQTAGQTQVVRLGFEKERFSREQEEQATTHAVITSLATVAGLHAFDFSKTPPGMTAASDVAAASDAWTELLLGERPLALEHGAPAVEAGALCLLPGSFNPSHAGHDEIAAYAARRSGRPVVYELSITNVDKPPLDHLEIRRRLAALAGKPVWLTRAPTFVEKARLAPGVIFAVGADTAERIGQGRYYADIATRDARLAEIADLGCRFLVFGRVEEERFVTLDDLQLPAALRRICEGVSESDFRRDVSSTALRGNA